ncbi:hypothetical protein BUALT_Bualt12G0085600 [Buddleja alternifolia]|uniref:F-box domain-containing protein n=1 Tax=Buddleja alternifolia TaxID=168488 RepID=A0AAV6WUI1_9LAMI|nr:hypothetical protein BUALT_Bualt12G0085600 [Buddleja alternifolia]
MSDIPSEVFHNIFCRVPAESLFLVRGVCKSWRQIIDDPDFIKSHIKSYHQSSSTTSLGQLLIRNENGGRLSSLSLDSLNFDYGNQTIEATPVKNLIRPGLPRLTPLPIASCNGLILITHSNVNKIWVLWNPLTQEFYELPEYDCPDLRFEACGLGYDCADDDYKVVRIDRMYHSQNSVYKTLVYSLKYDSWKWINDCPVNVSGRSQGIYLNGVLYWMSWDCIIALDFSTEDYRQLPLPSVGSEQRTYSDVNLDVLGGCLVVSCKHKTKRFDGWVMKENGGNISWTKLFSFPNLHDIGYMGHLRPITYSKSNRHVLVQHNNDFFWLDTDSNTAKKIQIHGLSRSFSCQVWQGSLFRLENIVGGDEGIGAKRTGRVKEMRAKKRLHGRPPILAIKEDTTICKRLKLDMTIT